MRLIILSFLLISLAACGFGSLSRLRLLAPEANDFHSALAAEYLAFADDESERGRNTSAEYFADKGVRAWHGEDVAPETVDNTLPKSHRERLKSARKLLGALLTDNVKRVVPQQAARAQVLFDCWTVEAAQHNKEASLCAEEFGPATAALEDVSTSFSPGNETRYTLRFAHGSGQLGKRGMAAIAAIAAAIPAGEEYAVDLEGRMRSKAARKLLSQRAKAIRSAFAARGIEHVQLKRAGSGKEVHLSADDKIQDPDLVRITVRIFSRDPS